MRICFACNKPMIFFFFFLPFLNYKVEHLRFFAFGENFLFVSKIPEQKKTRMKNVNSITNHKYQLIKICKKCICTEK